MTTDVGRLPWDNSFTDELPADPEEANRLRQVLGALFSRVEPTPVSAPSLIAYSPEVAGLLGLSDGQMRSEAMLEALAGNRVLPGMDTYAMSYGGHQFGNWAGQLGDGRAIGLGELRSSGGRWMLQLKGAGPTPYSRSADGRAVLRSSIREYLCSEAMHVLGVPTTRALSLVGTGDDVVRDMFYDGHPEAEPGAIVCRVAPSFIRLGSFELPTSRGDIELLRKLADYTIRHFFPELANATDPDRRTYTEFFDEVCRRTADLMVDWMRVGFVHGVMNTDNLSVHGITIDYGPYGWLEDFDPGWTPNTTDAHMKRYQYGNQPGIAQWNLLRFANALYPLIDDAVPFQEALDGYAERFTTGYRRAWGAKLGLVAPAAGDDDLFEDLAKILQTVETDMPIFYRHLANVDLDDRTGDAVPPALVEAYYQPEQINGAYLTHLHAWLDRYRDRTAALAPPDRKTVMDAANPRYVLRNYIAQIVIDAATNGDYSVLADVHDVLRRPYDDQPGRERWAQRRPEWARVRPGCSMLSCSS